jgi:hypothetical protein
LKTGRNQPCPCGSGKKYKVCCLKQDEARARESAPLPVPAPFDRHADLVPDDPRWRDFDRADFAGKVAIIREWLPDPQLLDDDVAFESLIALFQAATTVEERECFIALLAEVRAQRPEVYQQEEGYIRNWELVNTVLLDRKDEARTVALEFASVTPKHLGEFVHALSPVWYRGWLDVLLPAYEAAWPRVGSSSTTTGTALSGLLCFEYLERGGSLPMDPALVKRLDEIGQVRIDVTEEWLGWVAGKREPQWTLADFADLGKRPALPPDEEDQDDYDDFDDADAEGEEGEGQEGDGEVGIPDPRLREIDPQILRMHMLTGDFLGWLHREKAVPLPTGEMVRCELTTYLDRAASGELDVPQSGRRSKAPVQPVNPLLPAAGTLERYLSGRVSLLSADYHEAGALFEHVPEWLEFLVLRGLGEPTQPGEIMRKLVPLARTWAELVAREGDPALTAGATRLVDRLSGTNAGG